MNTYLIELLLVIEIEENNTYIIRHMVNANYDR